MKAWKKAAIGTFAVIGGLFSLLVVGVIALASMQPKVESTPQPTYAIAKPDEILTLVNQKRGEAGVEPLIESNELDTSAQFKAEDMANRGYTEHTDPSTGKNNGIDKAFELTGSFCRNISENIHDGTEMYTTTNAAVSAWMNSQSHRDAMLASKYAYTGVGVAVDKNGKVYEVQHFCQKM